MRWHPSTRGEVQFSEYFTWVVRKREPGLYVLCEIVGLRPTGDGGTEATCRARRTFPTMEAAKRHAQRIEENLDENFQRRLFR